MDIPDILRDLTLTDDANTAPIKILRPTCRGKLAQHLDPEVNHFDNDIDHLTDYRGVAELIGFNYQKIMQFARSPKGPTQAMLDEWETFIGQEPTVGKLWEYLIKLRRYDVMTDCFGTIVKDVEDAKRNNIQPLMSDPDTGCSDHQVDGNLILTKDDVTYGRPQYYDAFVCCNLEGEGDVRFVQRMVEVLETERGIRLCVPDRDGLPGASKYEQYSSLIKSRCRMMIVVLSQTYLESPAADFQVKFAQALSPATKKKKLVPVLIEKMDMPNILRALTLCDFTKKDMEEWNWDRLCKTLRESEQSSWSQEFPTNPRPRLPRLNIERQTPKVEKVSPVKSFFRNVFGKRK